MSLLVALLFFIFGAIYVFVIHKNEYNLAPYISGIIAGICSIPLVLVSKCDFYSSPNIFLYSFSYFLFYFLLPSFFGLVLYFLLNFKSIDLRFIPIALAGIWCVFLFFAAYDMAKTPDNSAYFILLLSYSASVLLCDILMSLLHFMNEWLMLAFSYLITMFVSYGLTFSFSLWLYKYSAFVYLGIQFICIAIFLFTVLFLKYKQEIHTKKTKAESLF